MKRWHLILAVILLACAGIALIAPASPVAKAAGTASADLPRSLTLGKTSLDTGEYAEAVRHFSTSRIELPLLDDYALFWRSRAYEGLKNYDQAIDDLKLLLKTSPDSPLVKAARFRMIELSQSAGATGIEELFNRYRADYPSDLRAKYAHAVFLRGTADKAGARALFRELFVTVSPYARNAAEELDRSDIPLADLQKKAKNLNSAWHFKDAEKYFRQALQRKDARAQKKELTEGLAYSVFMQKRYRDAAELYHETGNRIWRAKALYRSGDSERFEKEVPGLLRMKDDRAADIVNAFGARNRRQGNTDKAIEIFDTVIAKFPAVKEEALWQKAWTYYRAEETAKALELFTKLHEAYRAPKYLYWKNRCLELLGKSDQMMTVEYVPNSKSSNFYAFLSASRQQGRLPAWTRPVDRCATYQVPDRVAMLRALGFNAEALTEISGSAARNLPEQDLVCMSSYFGTLNDFKTAISLAQKVTYRDEYHDLYYPLAFLENVESAATANGLDPFLVLALMREESRFATDARSSAGALGLMQLMPATAFRVSKTSGLTLRHAEELYQAATNIRVGTAYLRMLVAHFDSIPKAVASYNAGEEAVKDWIAKGKYRSTDEFIEDIPYDETRNYVRKVMTSYFEYLRITGNHDAPPLFP